jgi:hypothetical protein
MINSNMAITVPSLWLKVVENVLHRQTTLERLTRSDEMTRFQTRGLLEGSQCNDPTIFPNNEALSIGVDVSQLGSKGG